MGKLNVRRMYNFYTDNNKNVEYKELVSSAINNFVYDDIKNPILMCLIVDLGIIDQSDVREYVIDSIIDE